MLCSASVARHGNSDLQKDVEWSMHGCRVVSGRRMPSIGLRVDRASEGDVFENICISSKQCSRALKSSFSSHFPKPDLLRLAPGLLRRSL